VELVEKRRSLYFKISVAIAAVAAVPISFLSYYFFYRHESNRLTEDFGVYWVNLLIFAEITPYFVPFAIVAAVRGIVGFLRARIVWVAILGEFLYVSLNVLIFNVAAVRDWHRFDLMDIATIGLLLCSISFGVVSLGIRKMSFRPVTDIMFWGTEGFFVLCILMLIGIMFPLGFRTISNIPEISWSFLFFWGAAVSLVAGVLILSSKLLLVVLFSLGIVALLRKWKYGYLYASLVLLLFGLRWLEMIVPIFYTAIDFRSGGYYDHSLGFSYGLFYKVLFAIGRFLGEKILLIAAMAIPALVSFLLGFLFLFRINEKAPEKT
jgi:hypothetical protein